MSKSRRYGFVLAALLILFILRVTAQLIQAVSPVSYLPAFDSWQSGTIPYWMLLVSQFLIIGFLGRIVQKFLFNKVVESQKLAIVYLSIGSVYLAVMVFRLIAGFSFANDHSWLGMHIPAIFHIVLALFLVAVGLFHSPYSSKIFAWTTYPVIMFFTLTFHILATGNGAGLFLSTYIPITASILLITLLETAFPYRRNWQFTKNDLTNDLTYLVTIQILLPRFLGFFLSLSLLNYLASNELNLGLYWPHGMSVYAQVVLMLLCADFLRYWLHRLSHNWKPLWVLHAVHHSPHKLYWGNVSRFHPIEKSIQYLFDTLPFVLIGISEQVLALYFVFYAINGFFQHCNIDIRMGVLNYLISGPELHRWHHSKLVEESNNNYGNNLIIWDLLFGSWFLPDQKEVATLGLVNRAYPLDFVSQLKTPFIAGLDKRT